MKEIADILIKQLRLLSEQSKRDFERDESEKLAEQSKAMCEVVDMCLHVQSFATMQDKLGRDD